MATGTTTNSNWWENLLGIGEGLFGNVGLQDIGSLALVEKTLDDLRDAGKLATSGAAAIGQQAQKDVQFQPFTVTTGTGDVLTTDEQGGYKVDLGSRYKLSDFI